MEFYFSSVLFSLTVKSSTFGPKLSTLPSKRSEYSDELANKVNGFYIFAALFHIIDEKFYIHLEVFYFSDETFYILT